MSKPEQLIREYLNGQHMMQLATVHDGKPWCCTVYYVTDESGNLYWASVPSRRHSHEVALNPHVAAAIPVKFINGEPVAGLQIEGTAKQLAPSEKIRAVAIAYAEKFNRTSQWVDDFVAGRTEHQLYQLTPRQFVLFDESNFPGDPQHTISPEQLKT